MVKQKIHNVKDLLEYINKINGKWTSSSNIDKDESHPVSQQVSQKNQYRLLQQQINYHPLQLTIKNLDLHTKNVYYKENIPLQKLLRNLY